MPYNAVKSPDHEILMQGEGLRPVLRYARLSPCIHIRVDYSMELPSMYAVTFTFDDGARCLTRWGDWRVLLNWLHARRSWNVERVYFAYPGMATEAEQQKPQTVAAIRKHGTLVLGS